MASLTGDQLRRLARLGAVARLAQLRDEEAAIRREFPELFGGGGRATAERAGKTPSARSARSARRRARMSASARKAVSERMKKHWAERRKARAGK